VASSVPERVDRLALIEALGPIPGKPDEAAAQLRRAVLARRALSANKTPRVIDDIEKAVDARLAVSDMTRDAARLIVTRNLRPVEGGFAWRSDPRLTLPSHVRTDESFIRSWVRAIEAPTLVIAADPAPPYFMPQVRDARAAELRDGRVEVVAGGHHLHMEQADVIAALLRPFLLRATPHPASPSAARTP
jgi:pimeloyl-ACP methyl ester carboxylesterase